MAENKYLEKIAGYVSIFPKKTGSILKGDLVNGKYSKKVADIASSIRTKGLIAGTKVATKKK